METPVSNDQFREFIGRFLILGKDERISGLDRGKLQDWINALSGKNGPEAFKKLVDFLNQGIELNKKFSSKLLKKTTALQIKECEGFEINEENIRSFLSLVYKREKERGNSVLTDHDLCGYFLGEKVAGIQKNFTSTIYRFLVDLTHQKILDESERTGVKRIYSFTEGFSIICEAILAGEVDEKGKGIFVYFKMKEDGPLYRFDAYRHDDGKLNFNVSKVTLGSEWGVGCGVFFNY